MYPTYGYYFFNTERNFFSNNSILAQHTSCEKSKAVYLAYVELWYGSSISWEIIFIKKLIILEYIKSTFRVSCKSVFAGENTNFTSSLYFKNVRSGSSYYFDKFIHSQNYNKGPNNLFTYSIHKTWTFEESPLYNDQKM